jgi:hypothetical protein
MSDTGARDKENGGLTAAEYVLGVLDADARRAAERRIARDMVFAREVAFWEERLGGLADAVPEVAPPADGWACIEAGLGSAATTEEPHGMVLTYHVVPGRITANDLMEMVKKAGGKAMLKTVEGEELTVEMKDGAIWIWDAKGDAAKITIKNVMQSNGVIHVIDTVLLPS